MNLPIAVIGCGSISRFHFAAFEKLGLEVRWVCDLNEAAARPYAERFNARFSKDYQQVLDDNIVKAVFVLTHSSTHKRICSAAIQAQKAVVCEKTLSENPQDSLEIIEQAREKRTIFYTSYMKRFIPAVEKARMLLPELGQIFSSHIRTFQPWGDLWSGNPSEGFFHSPSSGPSMVVKYYGGGILVCGGSHLLDLVGFFFGRPSKLAAAMVQPAYLDYDLLISAMLYTDNGLVHLEAAAHPLNKIGFLRDGWDEKIEINGTQGRIEIFSALWDQPYTKDSLLIHYDNRNGSVHEYRFGPVSPFERAIEFFCANISLGKQTQPDTTGYDVDELIAHIKSSASLGGQLMDLKWKI